jgi:uncharacterized protein
MPAMRLRLRRFFLLLALVVELAAIAVISTYYERHGYGCRLVYPPDAPWWHPSECAPRGQIDGASVLLGAGLAVAAATYPTLTGRVVDQANVLSAGARDRLTVRLADLEHKSGIQLVVATVSSLQGEEIEPYATGLFNTWQLGEKTKNNGVLLLVASNERRVRIEVGYGLEGTLTNYLAKVIIVNAITPRFMVNDFDGGVTRGVDDIITALTGPHTGP